MRKQTLGVDPKRVTPWEAVELMIHHLELARMYYEATPNEHEEVKKETIRIMERDEKNPPDLQAAMVWLDKIKQVYDEM